MATESKAQFPPPLIAATALTPRRASSPHPIESIPADARSCLFAGIIDAPSRQSIHGEGETKARSPATRSRVRTNVAAGCPALALLLAGLLQCAPAFAQSRTIFGSGYAITGSGQNLGFTFTLPNGTATGTSSVSACQNSPIVIDLTANANASPNATTPGFFAPAIPANTAGIVFNYARNGGLAGCAATTAPVGSVTINFAANVDPNALRLHFINLDAGTVVIGTPGLAPNQPLAGNTVFDIVGQRINNAALVAQLTGCQDNAGGNPTGSCGSVNFSSASATIPSINWQALDVDSSAGGGDGNTLLVSITQPSLQIRKQTLGGVGSNSFTFNYPSNVVSNAPAGNVAATTETIVVAANNSFVSGQARFIANSGANTAITEPVPAGWTLSAAQCVDLANGNNVVATLAAPVNGPANATLTLAAASVVPTAQIQCSFTNQANADLSISKTNTPLAGSRDQPNDVVTRGPITYTLVATNHGPLPVQGAIVRDTPVAGITCAPGNAVTISGNGVPSGSFTVANLTGAGITLGTLGAGQSATLVFDCTVN